MERKRESSCRVAERREGSIDRDLEEDGRRESERQR